MDITIQGKKFTPYITASDLEKIGARLAREISQVYHGLEEPLLLISILDGSFIFMADLVRKLDMPVEIQFVKLASYEDTESTGYVNVVLDIREDLVGRHVLIVEDIIDTGLTLESFVSIIQAKKPASIRICTLLSKPEVHNDIVKVDFVGKEIPPDFVIGYGLDINGEARNLPDIYRLTV